MAGKLDVNSRAAQDSPTSSSVAVAISGKRDQKPADNATRGNCSLEPHLASRLQNAHRQWTEDGADSWQAAAPPATGAGGSSGPCITYDRADRRARPHRPRCHVMPAPPPGQTADRDARELRSWPSPGTAAMRRWWWSGARPALRERRRGAGQPVHACPGEPLPRIFRRPLPASAPTPPPGLGRDAGVSIESFENVSMRQFMWQNDLPQLARFVMNA